MTWVRVDLVSTGWWTLDSHFSSGASTTKERINLTISSWNSLKWSNTIASSNVEDSIAPFIFPFRRRVLNWIRKSIQFRLKENDPTVRIFFFALPATVVRSVFGDLNHFITILAPLHCIAFVIEKKPWCHRWHHDIIHFLDDSDSIQHTSFVQCQPSNFRQSPLFWNKSTTWYNHFDNHEASRYRYHIAPCNNANSSILYFLFLFWFRSCSSSKE